MIFTYFIIKQFGAPLITFNMIAVSVCMPIIGRTTEESHMCICMTPSHANSGTPMISSGNTKTDVKINIIVINAMAGNSLNIILKTIDQDPVRVAFNATRDIPALIFMLYQKKDLCLLMYKLNFLDLLQEIE